MTANTVIRYISYLVLITAGFGIAAGITNADPVLALSSIALAFAEVTIIALTIQLDSKDPRR